MEMINVESSNINSIGYNADDAMLVIEFNGGATYEYYDVPSYVYDELMSADSKGSYAHQNIYKNYSQDKIR